MDSTKTFQNFDLFARISEVVTFDNIPMLAAITVSFICGYVQYYYAVRLSFSEKKGPFPLWMHLFYFAHDTTWSHLLNNAAPDYNYHWFLTCSVWGCRVWIVLEVICISRATFVEGEDIISDPLRRRSRAQSLWYIALFTVMMYGLLFLGTAMMGPTCFFHWGAICNIIMAFGPTTTWLRRRSRNGLSVGLTLSIVAGTIFTFAPFGMWVQVAPEIFDRPTFYFIGVVLTMLSITNVFMVASYPPKNPKMGKNSPIW